LTLCVAENKASRRPLAGGATRNLMFFATIVPLRL
jgi:hypothetical protein